MTSVTFDPALGGDGSTVSDDANPTTGLRAGGYRTRFAAALAQMVAMMGFTKGQAQIATDAALSALNAPATSATSVTSLSLTDTGNITLTLAEVGKAFTKSMTIGLGVDSDPAKFMTGVITAFNSNTGLMTVAMQSKSASGGPFAAWNVFRTSSAGVPATRAVGVSGGLLTGGGTLAADFSIGLSKADAGEIAGGTVDDEVMTPKGWADSGIRQTLVDAANIAWPITRRKAKVTLGGNRAMLAPSGMVEGGEYSLAIIQDGTGGRSLSWAGCYDFGIDGVPILSTGAAKIDMVYLECLDATAPLFKCTFKQAA